MTERSSDQLRFPQGRLAVWGQNAINPTATRSEAAAATHRINEPDHLIHIMTDQPTLLSQTTELGAVNSIVRPTGPYTNRAVMEGMYRRDVKDPHETQWVYDYTPSEQRDYWKLVLAGLHAGKQILEEEGRAEEVINLYAENTTHVSDISQRTSRTIRFPHGHFIEIDPETIHSTTSVLHHMQEEQDLLERRELVERFGLRVMQRMPNYGAKILDEFDVRQTAPFGYQFSLDAELTQQNIEKLAKTLEEHHHALTEVSNITLHAANRALSQEFKNRLKDVKRTPSYRLYLALNSGKLDVIISPEFWSHGGVLEAMNITLDRDESHTPFPMDQRLDFERKFAGKVNTMLESIPVMPEQV